MYSNGFDYDDHAARYTGSYVELTMGYLRSAKENALIKMLMNVIGRLS